MRRSTSSRGFSLIEAAVAVAIMAILAGAAAPLMTRALNQAREQKTRENLKTAFEAMFGTRDHRIANMRADFGFDPGTVGLSNLALMTNRTGVYVAAQTPPVYAYNAVAGFSWGWNGPYWTGPVQPSAGLPGGLPVDGWGKPIQLRVTNVAGSIYYQLVSGGANGQIGGAFAADDIVYPTNPMPRTALYSTLSVNIYNRSSATVTGISFMSQQKAQSNNLPGPSSVSLNGSWVVGASVNQSLTNQLPGPMTLTIQRTLPNTPPISSTVYVGDLLPGEYRIIDTAIN